MLTINGPTRRTCDGLSRRTLLQAGGAGLLGLSLPELLAAESQSTQVPARAKSVIFLMLFGGPSQLETFDLKPDAPEQIRGPFKPIACRTPELLIGEHLPQTAAISDKYCVIRTMTHSFNDHSGGGHYLQTGRRWHVPIGGGFTPTPRDWPSMGAVVEYLDQQRFGLASPLPSYMVLPNSLGRLQEAGQYPRPGEHAGWLGKRFNPLTTQIEKKSLTDNPYWRDCSDDELTFAIAGMSNRDGITLDRLQSRQSLLSQFDSELRRAERTAGEYDAFRERAAALVTSPKTRDALDIRREPANLRDRYGRHLFGQSCLMARRLVEAGVRFVTVHYDCVDGYSWDSHRNSDDVKKHLLPTFDQAYAALIRDLDERGLLADTLVLATGEMGRTPKANPQWGRDHWSMLFPAVLAGGGIVGGRVYGKSDKDAAYPLEKATSPEDLAATIYYALGIDPDLRLPSVDKRPTAIVDGGNPVTALWS
ncbi:MAG: hypothetical protein RIS70_4168 [Planctomycetota bacterium]|jgi:uncharacterized protein (DUF1501 family)